MAQRKQSSSRKQQSQGTGRKASSEPRIQTFRDFGGCNFELSPHQFTLGMDHDEEQSDIQMNFVVVQNNAGIASNKTIETRENIKQMFSAPFGTTFTDSAVLIGQELYVACDDGSIRYGNLGGSLDGSVAIRDVDDQDKDNHWTALGYADDKLVGMTKGKQMWTGAIGTHSISNARKVPDPPAPTMANLDPKGTLKVSPTMTDECAFRIGVSYTYVNKFGPTAVSDQLPFYASAPVSEWHGGCYLTLKGTAPAGYAIEAVELYYVVDNASSLMFAGRTDFAGGDGGPWDYNWVGYLNDVSMWPMANLSAPDKNYTEGVPASKMTTIDGRLYFWGADPAYRIYIGGNPGNLFSISPGTGGGFVDVDPGTGQEIRVVTKYKTQSGNSIVTMLCDSPNSQSEMRHNLVENTISLSNEQTMKSWQAEQVSGAVGCKSYHGAQVCEDGLYAVSRYGIALTTMTMEYNSQIKTTYVSDPIRPAFVEKYGTQLSDATLLSIDGVLYMSFGKGDDELDNMVFCYDIALKSWWTITLDIDEPIIRLMDLDWQGHQEGIGIITPNHVYMLPTTRGKDPSEPATFDVLIETGELSTAMPQQQFQHLSQIEFRFDYFVGDVTVECIGIDVFGRKMSTAKRIRHDEVRFSLAEHIRVDLKLQSYKLRIHGKASFRLTHFMAKLFTLSNRIGTVWGFDDSQSYRSHGDIHPTFKDYNDIRKALFA